MTITDEALQNLHDHPQGINDESVGTVKELLAELLQARKVTPVARTISGIAPMLRSSIVALEQEGCASKDLYLAIVHKKPDGSGKVGPVWGVSSFVQNLETLGFLVHTDDEVAQQVADSLAEIFGLPRG